jgi:uncharacterized membrane-anchored protein
MLYNITDMDTIKKIPWNKVPEITLYFWIIKILCTTVGETAADFLNGTLNFGLTSTTVVMGALLLIVLFFQFRVEKYVPQLYWLAVVLLSVVGTLITDNLTDNLGISLVSTTGVFAIILAIIFTLWYQKEKTLSIHTINTRSREGFYWMAILFTFALGTAAGDLLAEKLNVGYFFSVLIFAALIALIYLAYKQFKFNAVWAFWLAYILTRPLGASIGDYLSQDRDAGGLALGTTMTSILFLVAILVTVLYLARTKKDVIKPA